MHSKLNWTEFTEIFKLNYGLGKVKLNLNLATALLVLIFLVYNIFLIFCNSLHVRSSSIFPPR